MWVWPALLLIIPLAGALVVALAPARQAKWIALVATTITFAVSVILAAGFEHWRDGGFGLAASVPWLGIEPVGVTITFGADSVSMLLTLLTTVLMPLCVWGSFSAITERVKEYYAWMLIIGAAMVGVFIARDLVLFYVCFEFTLVPMYFLIAIWGSDNRARACTKFFLYTFTGSLIALAGLLYVAWQYAEANASILADGSSRLGWTFDIARLTAFSASQLSASEQAWVLFALLAATVWPHRRLLVLWIVGLVEGVPPLLEPSPESESVDSQTPSQQRSRRSPGISACSKMSTSTSGMWPKLR